MSTLNRAVLEEGGGDGDCLFRLMVLTVFQPVVDFGHTHVIMSVDVITTSWRRGSYGWITIQVKGRRSIKDCSLFIIPRHQRAQYPT